MKVVGPINGIAAVYAPADEVVPLEGLTTTDLVNFVGETYNFAVRPEGITNATPTPPLLSFQSGKLVNDTGSYPIQHMTLLGNGDAVGAQNTDIATIVLNDLIGRLRDELKFRYTPKHRPRFYLSTLVVKFERPIEDQLAAFGRIEAILNSHLPRENAPFKPKALSFGCGDPGGLNFQDVRDHAKVDFMLQRRVGFPYSENAYFSVMPAPTDMHIAILEEIEKAFAG